MVSPLLLLAGAGALLFTLAPKPRERSTVDSIIDASELGAPNAAAVRSIVLQAMSTNSLGALENAAKFSEVAGLPKTAANVRAYRSMVQSGGSAVAGDDDAVSGDDEVGARRARPAKRKTPLPDWLRFQATQSKLSGDPAHIRATAVAMKRFGYRRAAEIHLELVD